MAPRADLDEEERLILQVQEALAEAIARSGKTRAAVARAAGLSQRSGLTRALSSGRNLTLRSAARILLATGHRLKVVLEKL